MDAIKASAIFADWQSHGLLTEHRGPDPVVTRLVPVDDCGPGDLVFMDKQAFAAPILERKPACVVTTAKLAEGLADQPDLAVLVAPNVKLARALLGQKYQDRELRGDQWEPVHPSATVHETARLGEGTRVEPGAVVGAGVVTGSQCVIMAGSVIEQGAKLGDQVVIHPNAVIGYDCELGDEVIVHSCAVIGGEGYGFAQDETGRSHRIPQLGRVVLEDRVRVGACNCIDRATHGETRIGAGTKMDNVVHIAHNVVTGRDCLLTAGFIVAGSTTLGNRVMATGATGINDHLTICDDAVFVHRAGVKGDVTKPGVYAGSPIQPMADYVKNTAAAKKLGDMVRKMRDLEARLAELEKDPV